MIGLTSGIEERSVCDGGFVSRVGENCFCLREYDSGSV